MRSSLVSLLAVIGLGTLLVGCALFGGGDDSGSTVDGGTGSPCTTNGQCGPGYVCAAGACALEGSVGLGGSCSANRDCSVGLFCSPVGVCAPGGSGGVGDPCATGAECGRELTCELFGFGGTCAATGTIDLGGTCTATTDCIAGLACAADGTCQRPRDAFPPFTGVQCSPDALPFRVFFEVPRPGVRLPDFFRLPFPNDARVGADGAIDLSDFPRPGPGLLGIDLVDLYADALAADFTGFSSIAAITFRLSGELEFNSVGPNGVGIQLVDVTGPEVPGFGNGRSRRFGYSTGAGLFVCQQTFQVSNDPFDPLLAGHTYAAFLTTQIRSKTGAIPEQDPDLVAVLGATQPTDPTLARVWEQYATFRAYLDDPDTEYDADDIAGLAVFTVQDTTGPALRLAEATRAGALPTLIDLTLCDGQATSPCDDGGPRACGAPSEDFYEIHGRYSVPNFQAGTLPYEKPADGGGIVFAEDGTPTPQGSLDVCFALTIPKGATAPAGGWPLVVHGHGTGGNFRAAASNGVAATLAQASTPMATFTFDGVGHGARRGASTRDPDSLVFNVINPAGARGNHLQGAVDVIQALRVAQVVGLDVTGVGPIAFDPGKVAFFGHSQGANVGIPAIATVDDAQAAIFSGAGSYLTEGIMTKTSPVNAKAGLEALIGESLNGGHPMMTIWQTYFDSIDPVNFAPLIVKAPPPGVASKHVWMSYGHDDSYSPESTMQITAQAMGLLQAAPALADLDIPDDPRPITTNRAGGDLVQRAAACFQYEPDGYDGHFVSTDNPTAVADWSAFLTSLAATGTPTVP